MTENVPQNYLYNAIIWCILCIESKELNQKKKGKEKRKEVTT
jgi:hypothetical protein